MRRLHSKTGKFVGRPSAAEKLTQRVEKALNDADAVLIPEPVTKAYETITSRIDSAVGIRDERKKAELRTKDWKDITGRDKFSLPQRGVGEPEFTTFNLPPPGLELIDAFFEICKFELIQKVCNYMNKKTEYFARHPGRRARDRARRPGCHP